MTQLATNLQELGAPEDLLEWVGKTGGDEASLWQSCPRGDWLAFLSMVKLIEDPEIDPKSILAGLAPVICATVKSYAAEVAEASKAINAAECWCRGEAPSDTKEKAERSLRRIVGERYGGEGAKPGAKVASWCACTAAADLAAAAASLNIEFSDEQVTWYPGGADGFRKAYWKTAAGSLASALFFATSAAVFASREQVTPERDADQLDPEGFATEARRHADEIRATLVVKKLPPKPAVTTPRPAAATAAQPEPKRPWWKVW